MIIEKIFIFSFVLIFFILEFKIPLRSYLFFSKQRKEDLLWTLLNQIAYPLFMLGIAYTLGSYVSSFASLSDLTSKPLLIQIICLVLITDFTSYWAHRGVHRIKPLWELHRLHHSTTELTVLSSFRHSWVDFFIQSSILGLSTGFLTVDSNVRLGVDTLFSLICMIQHTNIRFKYPKLLELLIITPKNHFWHHSVELKKSYGQNFGFLFPWWDMIFKTHYNPDHQDSELGLSDSFRYSSFSNKFFHPFDKIFRSK